MWGLPPVEMQVGAIFPMLRLPPCFILVIHWDPATPNSLLLEALSMAEPYGSLQLGVSWLFAEVPQMQYWWQLFLVHSMASPTHIQV